MKRMTLRKLRHRKHRPQGGRRAEPHNAENPKAAKATLRLSTSSATT